MKILYVEDNDINRLVLTKLMANKAVVLTAENGHQAKEMVSSAEFDLFLLDLNLNDPEMDGFDVLRELKKMPHLAKSKFFAVTAYFGIEWQRKCLNAGFDGFFSKPFKVEDILETYEKMA